MKNLSRNKKILFIAIIFVIVGLILYFILGNQAKNNTNYATPTTNQGTPVAKTHGSVTIVSDVKNITIKNINEERMKMIANNFDIFTSDKNTYHNEKGNIAHGKINSITIRITDDAKAPLYAHNNLITTNSDTQGQNAYSTVVDENTHDANIYIYYSDSYMNTVDIATLQSNTWRTTLRAIYEIVNPPSASSSSDPRLSSFVGVNASLLPFELAK